MLIARNPWPVEGRAQVTQSKRREEREREEDEGAALTYW